MKRRVFVTSGGLTVAALVAGCLDSAGDESSEEREASSTEDDTTDEGENDETDSPRKDSIFVENLTESDVTVEVRVEQKDDTERLVDNSYTVPEGVGLEIPDIGEVGSEYTTTVVHDGETETFDWRVLTCTNDADDSGATDLGIEVADDGVWIGNNGCDETGAGDRRELTYEHHEDYIENA